MKFIHNIFCLTCVLSIFTPLFLSGLSSSNPNSLRVQDPQLTWRSGVARIDAATFSVRPKGLYAEVTLNMTYSSQGTTLLQASDTLEIQHYFTLPDNASVIDSWLWVDNEIVLAKLVDRWTASQIYEGIVKRRKDPSILFKNSPTNYEYRIFPMSGNKTRRVQLTFLLPFDWQKGIASVELPLNIIKQSNRFPPVNIRVFDNSTWKNARFSDFPSQNLAVTTDSTTGVPIRTTVLTDAQIMAGAIRLTFDSPMKNGVFVSTFTQGNDSYYQMAVQPDKVLNTISPPQKVLFLLDFGEGYTNMTALDFMNSFKLNARNTINARDSFNIMFSRLTPTPLSNRWISGTQLDSTLAQITEVNLSTFRSTPNLLGQGLTYLKNNNGGVLSLLSNDAALSSIANANALLAELKTISNPLPKIHVFDFNTLSYSSVWYNNQYYYGNDYLYGLLTAQAGGNFINTPYSAYSNNYNPNVRSYMLQYFTGFTPYYENFDTYTTLSNGGFCYARFNLGSTPLAYINRAIVQTGKMVGQTPFQIELSGTFNAVPFSKRVTVADSLITAGDSSLVQGWATSQLLAWEAPTTRDNAAIRRIIDKIGRASCRERV